MAFNKTERFSKLAITTSTRIGPGTYDVSDLSKPLRDPNRMYPFLSGASRKTLGILKEAQMLPGPASYNIKASRKRILERGGVSINYTDVRFKKEISEGPGPTDYILPDYSFKETPRGLKSRSCTYRSPAGKIWLTRPRPIIPTGPSVPSKRDTGGYDFNEHGILVKRPVIKPKVTDFYDVPREETNFTTLRYKGNFWSRMKGRDDGRTSVTPGPGDYEHETKKTIVHIHDERIREAKRAATKQTRFLEALYQQKLRQNFPAPNYYETSKSVFDQKKQFRCRHMVQSAPFNQSAARFAETIQSDVPGPGAYETTKQQFCYGSIYHAPFGAFSVRWMKFVDSIIPGPGDYHTDIGNLAYESEKRFKNKHRRIINDIYTYEISKSENNHYDYMPYAKYKVMEEKKSVYHSVFKSRVDRFPEINRDIDVPDPGAYETLSAFKANRDRCEFLCQRLAPPFGSHASRFPVIPKDVDFHISGVVCTGPLLYDVRRDISKNVKGGVIYYSPREKKEDTKGPGPAHYYINPYVASTVVKKSFNVTLGKRKIVEHMNKTQIPWRHQRSKKILCTLNTPCKEYCTSISY